MAHLQLNMYGQHLATAFTIAVERTSTLHLFAIGMPPPGQTINQIKNILKKALIHFELKKVCFCASMCVFIYVYGICMVFQYLEWTLKSFRFARAVGMKTGAVR
jgi:hypothetical protein